VLATSRALTPTQKKELAALIGPPLQNEDDIIGAEDLNGLIRKYPDIEKSHIKLWLSGVGVLERVVRSAAHTINKITREEIEAKVRVYAPNPSFNGACDTLEAHYLVIISGPPGVGKTEMLSYAYIAESWELVSIRSLDDGFAAIEDSKKQVFFFDDFLGRVALNRNALSHQDSNLARFIKRVRKSPNARFILTRRAYIFEEARLVSEISGGPAWVRFRERRGLSLEVRRSTRGTTGVRHASTTTATRAILMGKNSLAGRRPNASSRSPRSVLGR
jgi:hypothetical protein